MILLFSHIEIKGQSYNSRIYEEITNIALGPKCVTLASPSIRLQKQKRNETKRKQTEEQKNNNKTKQNKTTAEEEEEEQKRTNKPQADPEIHPSSTVNSKVQS